ncbi:MAG: DpnD/PcfM family protein [Synergistaceae bacterium]|nr:DpnD/PcfM family protein [Synergistaceae bacterium]
METLFKIVTIEAETVEDAHTKVRERWHNSEYILDADDFAGVEFGVLPAENGD